jgi:signal transduction histidine kinase
LCAIVVSIVYAPHLLFQWGGNLTMEMEKYLEIVLYNIVGGMTGLLSQKERERTLALQASEENLKRAYEDYRLQSKQISMIEEQLRDAERLSSVGEMSAVLAHEIRNPLASIRGTAEILQGVFKPDDKLYEFLTMQIKETDRLDNVVKDFLRFARPVVIRPERCNIREELHTIIALVSQETGSKKPVVELSAESLSIIKADGQKLRQAFLNLIQNAMQAAGDGGYVKVTAVNEQTDHGNSIVIHVDDNGPGIAPDAREKLFEPFFTTKPDGTGLGLPTTRKIVEGHGGAVDIEVSPLGGARFTVRLPAKQTEKE